MFSSLRLSISASLGTAYLPFSPRSADWNRHHQSFSVRGYAELVRILVSYIFLPCTTVKLAFAHISEQSRVFSVSVSAFQFISPNTDWPEIKRDYADRDVL